MPWNPLKITQIDNASYLCTIMHEIGRQSFQKHIKFETYFLNS